MYNPIIMPTMRQFLEGILAGYNMIAQYLFLISKKTEPL